MTDAQLATLWEDTNTSIWLVGHMMNSYSFGRLIAMFLGLLIITSFITAIFTGIYKMLGFRSRD